MTGGVLYMAYRMLVAAGIVGLRLGLLDRVIEGTELNPVGTVSHQKRNSATVKNNFWRRSTTAPTNTP